MSRHVRGMRCSWQVQIKIVELTTSLVWLISSTSL